MASGGAGNRVSRPGATAADGRRDKVKATTQRTRVVASRDPIWRRYARTCLLTSAVISNMFTCGLPKMGRSLSSALIMRLFF